jgi:hypothetical protein
MTAPAQPADQGVKLPPYPRWKIAKAMHEAIRLMQTAASDESIALPWEEAEDWQQEDTYETINRMQDYEHTAEQEWELWAAAKRAGGWTWGETKDPAKKTHPCLVDTFTLLPAPQRAKDDMIILMFNVASGRF